MSVDRYVVAGLAHVRSAWFTEVSRWATVGSLPAEFVKCVSVDELRVRLASGRPFSAVLVDARLPVVDRDLLAVIEAAGAAPVVVTHGNELVSWGSIGSVATLGPSFTRTELLDALATHARPVDLVDHQTVVTEAVRGSRWRAPLVAVTGNPGAGTSTVAIACAQALAADPRTAGDVVLADLSRHAHQAILHDARDVVPGLLELVEGHRSSHMDNDAVRALTFDVPARGYRLLLGLRRPRDWVSIRSVALAAGLDGLRRSARVVVADLDGDLEGEAETGSFDIEERNLVARHTIAEADVVVVTASPTATGLCGLVHLLGELRDHGVPDERMVIALTRAPRRPRQRAELARTVADLTGPPLALRSADGDRTGPMGPVFVAERRNIEVLHRDVARLPERLGAALGLAVRTVLDHHGVRAGVEPELAPVVPGTLGHWGDAAAPGDGDETGGIAPDE
jgi:hypothetical protein